MLSNEYLIKLADMCDQMGHKEIADEMDNLIRTGSFLKVSQYVGTVGYILKNQRAMANCLRKKRVASDESMQNVVMECLKEYQDGQRYDDEEWIGKYASLDSKQYVDSFLKTAIVNGVDINTATRKLIEKLSNDNDLSEDYDNMNKVADLIKSAGLQDREEFVFFSNVLNKLAAGEMGKAVNWLRYRMPSMPGGAGSFSSQVKNIQSNLQKLQNYQRVLNQNLSMFVPSSTVSQKDLSNLHSAITQGNFNYIAQALASFQNASKNNPAILKHTNNSIKLLQSVINTVKLISTGLAPLMQNSRARKSAGNYINQANEILTNLSKNPLNQQNVSGLSTALHNMDMALQKSMVNTPQPAQAPQQAPQAQQGVPQPQTAPQQVPRPGVKPPVKPKTKTTKDVCQSLKEVQQFLGSDPKTQPLVNQLNSAFTQKCPTGKNP